MSDVYLGFGILLSLGIVFPGLIFTWWLLFPQMTTRAAVRLAHAPGRTFLFGILLSLGIGVLVLIMANLPLPGANIIAVGLIVIALAIAAIGTAGLTHWLAQRVRERSKPGLSEVSGFLRAVIALELAAAFPIIGWFLFIPLCLIICLGAAGLALVSRRSSYQPAPATGEEPHIVITAAGVSDVA
jgi:hypothetical protein